MDILGGGGGRIVEMWEGGQRIKWWVDKGIKNLQRGSLDNKLWKGLSHEMDETKVRSIGPKKGRGKFLNFSDAPIPEKNILYFLRQMRNPLRLTMLFSPSYWSVQQVSDSHWLDECTNRHI
jgi:hypothetical protein